jgi:uncharacterized membrane protein HdeD (DUF308 family)
MNKTTNNKGWSIFWGVALMILGLITIGAQVFTTMISVFFLGWMLIIGGVIEFFYAFFSGGLGRAIIFIVGGIATFIVGLTIASNPGLSATAITMIIGIYMLIIGLYNALAALFTRHQNWGWNMAGGIITLLLGSIILAHWPVSGTWVIGLFIGVELFIVGYGLAIATYSPEYNQDTNYNESGYLSGAKGGRSSKKHDTDTYDERYE